MLQDLYDDSLAVHQRDCRMSVTALLVTVKLIAYCHAERAYGYGPQWLSASHPVTNVLIFYYYRYSAIGPVWAETRAQSGNWYSSGTLHPGQVLRGRLPFLSSTF